MSIAQVVMHGQTRHLRGEPSAQAIDAEQLGRNLAQGVGAVVGTE